MKKINIIILSILISLSVIFILFLNPLIKSYVVVDGKLFFVDVARTEEQKAKGLDIYNTLAQNKGMLFPFNSSDYYPFWMRGMNFPIDIIYINDNQIVDIFDNLPNPKTEDEFPITVKPTAKANYVLEINAGLSRKYNFKKGDIVKIHL